MKKLNTYIAESLDTKKTKKDLAILKKTAKIDYQTQLDEIKFVEDFIEDIENGITMSNGTVVEVTDVEYDLSSRTQVVIFPYFDVDSIEDDFNIVNEMYKIFKDTKYDLAFVDQNHSRYLGRGVALYFEVK